MKWKLNHVAILLAASMLALVGLVYFQYQWIAHSRKLSDEIFHQQVSMAVCSTIEQCGSKVKCTPEQCTVTKNLCNPAENIPPATSGGLLDDEFHTELKKTLDFYNINIPFQIQQYSSSPDHLKERISPSCVVNIPPEEDQAESFVSLVFPSRDTYMVDRLKYMIGASLFILLFTAMVLLLANWWLMKQKRLLYRNKEMYNTMAHEFRTPLTNIQLAAQMINQTTSAQDQQKFLAIISKENSRLIQQVERVLDHARLDHQDNLLHPEYFKLTTLLKEVYNEMEIQILERKAKVTFTDVPPELNIMGDRQHLANVFRNLIDNALKYSTDHPEVHISAKEEKGGVLISVQDNGIGIQPAESRLIFQKFHRSPEGQDQKGFGLGLPYVKRIIELHKGFIQVDCGIAQGSRFNVFLPKIA